MAIGLIVEDIASLLSSSGYGTLGENLFGYEWGNSDDQVLILNSSGTPSDLKDLYINEGLQILVRGNQREAAGDVYTKAYSIYEFLVKLSENVEINGTNYKGFEPTSNIAPLGKDENERHLFSMNFETYRGII